MSPRPSTSTALCFAPTMKHAGAIKNDHLSQRWQQAREHAGLSKADAAEQLGIKPQLLGRIEAGSARDSTAPGLTQRAAEVYGVSANWLWAGTCAPERFWPEWVSA